MEDKKMHGMIVAIAIGLAVVIGVILIALLLTPPLQTHARHRPPPQPSVKEYTVRDRSYSREEVPSERRHARKPSPHEDEEEEMRRQKVRLAAQKVVYERASLESPNVSLSLSTNLTNEKLGGVQRTNELHAAPHPANEEGNVNRDAPVPLNAQVAAQMVVPSAAPRKPRTPPPRRGKRIQILYKSSWHEANAKSSMLEPTDTLPAHPVVCVVHSSAMVEVSYPHDGLCDAVILNKVFYHSGQVSVSQGENHTYQEFLAAAAKSKLTAYMLATDRYFAYYETVPAAPSLEALRKMNIRGFGFLGIRIQSAQGELLKQHTRLLRSQVEDLAGMLKEVEVTDSIVFLGVTTEEHMFKDDIATSAFKLLVTSVQVHLLIIENHQLKHDNCLRSPITTWSNASGIAFDEPQATASWMTESGIRPALPHTVVAFSSWIPAMQFLRSADATTETWNGTRRCFVFSLSPYDNMVCSQPRRYHNVSGMYFAKDEAMQGIYVYEDPAILKDKVMQVRRAMSGVTSNVGWAFYGLEYESDDAGQCGSRHDRISTVKAALRSLRAFRVL
ncbi:uncharacterized protein LOC142765312 [Rhipicephalus microplus]|uniref:uncharacterized protein LOC142765312 n=1 Tax=Rhipicephalus microplus TaxID=6941 RepID=UPI003F6B3277